MTREKLSVYFFVALFLFLLYQLLLILSPFVGGLLLAGVAVLIAYPLHRNVQIFLKDRKNLAALLSSAVVVLTIGIPLLFFLWNAIQEVARILPRTEDFLQGSWPLFKKLESFFIPYGMDLREMLRSVAQGVSDFVLESGKKTLQNTFQFVVNVGVFMMATFFLFRDGPTFLTKIQELIPMDPKDKKLIVERLSETTLAVVRGVFIAAAAQGVASGIGYWIAGATAPVTLAFLTALVACIPFVGPPVVWGPIALLLCLEERFAAGIFLVVWGGVVVGLVDNFLRPVLIGRGAKLPFLWLFFGLLGGVHLYGIKGLLMGPLLIVVMFTLVSIYRERYLLRTG
ncbi:MAG: AI-2E family transporter [Deltaproteobacteria bacterium]|nr:AI-2E family transporter [Deltaproteobacteria bacterium]